MLRRKMSEDLEKNTAGDKNVPRETALSKVFCLRRKRLFFNLRRPFDHKEGKFFPYRPFTDRSMHSL